MDTISVTAFGMDCASSGGQKCRNSFISKSSNRKIGNANNVPCSGAKTNMDICGIRYFRRIERCTGAIWLYRPVST